VDGKPRKCQGEHAQIKIGPSRRSEATKLRELTRATRREKREVRPTKGLFDQDRVHSSPSRVAMARFARAAASWCPHIEIGLQDFRVDAWSLCFRWMAGATSPSS
jgi:hypothetical protein